MVFSVSIDDIDESRTAFCRKFDDRLIDLIHYPSFARRTNRNTQFIDPLFDTPGRFYAGTQLKLLAQ